MNSLTEDNVKVIVQDMMNEKVVYRSNCKERHLGVDKLEEKVNSMNTRLWLIMIVLLGNLIGMVSWLIRG